MPQIKLSDHDVEMIRAFLEFGVPVKSLASDYGVAMTTVYAIKYGDTHRKRRKPYSNRGLSYQQVREIKDMITSGKTDTRIAKETGVSRGAIYCIRIGKSYQEVPWARG